VCDGVRCVIDVVFVCVYGIVLYGVWSKMSDVSGGDREKGGEDRVRYDMI